MRQTTVTSVTVNPPPSLPAVTLSSFSNVCENAINFALAGGSPSGGTYSGTGVSSGIFNPTTAGVATHTITYSYTDGNGCTNTATKNITVNALPTVTLGTFSDVCLNGGAQVLTGGSPALGIYSGAGVSSGSFDPAIGAIGTHTISYFYSDGNGCTNTATSNITVTSCTGLLDGTSANNVSLFPNPSDGIVTISSSYPGSTIELYDGQGKMVYREIIAGNQGVLHLENLAEGIYTYKLLHESDVKIGKVVIK